jgi:hypothetical protein
MEEITEKEKEDPVKKSIYPRLQSGKFESIKENINEKKKYIGNSLLTFYEFKNTEKKKKVDKNQIKKHEKIVKKNPIKLFFQPKENKEKTRFFGRTQNIKLPKEVFIQRMRKNLKNDFNFNFEVSNLNTKETFFNTMQNSKEIQNINEQNSITQNISLDLKNLNNKNKTKTHFLKNKNFNNYFMKTVRKLDYENGIMKNTIKKEKRFFDEIKNDVDDKYKVYHWKYIMTDEQKDLRPNSFFGKVGENVFQKGFNKQLDSMISNLKNVDAVNVNVENRKKEKQKIEESIQKRIKEEKVNRDLINNILERNQVISSLILQKEI